MVQISADQVVKLRKLSGQGMMDCKVALQEAEGDVEKALAILRKKGLATLARRAERETSEGLVVGKASPDGKVAVLATLCCETDFVAKSEDFVQAADQLANYAMACQGQGGTAEIMEMSLNGRKFTDIVTETVSKVGEKITIGDYAKFRLDGAGLISTYIHFNKKVGTMVQIDTGDEKTAGAEPMKRIGADIAMHITAAKPLALDRSGISAEIIEQEKSIAAAQIKNKPANIVDKIVEGKIKKFYEENCLLEQQFVKDNTRTVSQVLAEAAKSAGGQARIERYVRFEVG